MIDREKVIKALEVCSSISDGEECPKECPYRGQDMYCIGSAGLMLDALDLLKEQTEIVRCRDCKYCKYPQSEKEWCKKGHLHGNAKNWFCGDGERR